MADLTASVVRHRDRGQLLLAAAFVLSILFVVLALLLNAAAVTALTANTAGSPAGAVQGPTLAADTERGLAAHIGLVNNGSSTSYSGLRDDLTHAVADWSNLSTRLAATRAGSTRLSVVDTTNGTRIVQRNASRNLTSAAWEGNWTLAADVTRITNYSLFLSGDGLVEPAESATATDLVNASTFHVVVKGTTSGDWRLFAYNDSNDVVIAVETPAGNFTTCRAAADDGTVLVEITNATVGGSDCPALDFVSSLDQTFSLAHERGSNAIGSYTAEVDVERSADTTKFGEIGSDLHPYERPILYDATVRLDVVRPSFTYNTSVTAAVGDRDD